MERRLLQSTRWRELRFEWAKIVLAFSWKETKAWWESPGLLLYLSFRCFSYQLNWRVALRNVETWLFPFSDCHPSSTFCKRSIKWIRNTGTELIFTGTSVRCEIWLQGKASPVDDFPALKFEFEGIAVTEIPELQYLTVQPEKYLTWDVRAMLLYIFLWKHNFCFRTSSAYCHHLLRLG